MKISELIKLANIRRDIEIPLAVQGENRSITMGQILDAVSQCIIPFGGFMSETQNIQYAPGSPTASTGVVIFDKVTNKFYLALMSSGSDSQSIMWTYFADWNGHAFYYENDGTVRMNCLFSTHDGRLYYYNGTTLKSAGITDEQADDLRHATPIEVESEEEMTNRIAAGEYEEGQLYFLAESE